MRLGTTSLLIFAGAFAALLVPHSVLAAVPALDSSLHIVPQTATNCALGWNGVLETIQNVMNAAVAIGVLAVVLTIGYAGVLWVTSPFNPSNREHGRKAVMTAFIGLALVLTSWLIVSAFMNIFYNAGPFGSQSWDSILQSTGSGPCLPALPNSSPLVGVTPLSAVQNGGLVIMQQPSGAADGNGFAIGCSTGNDANVSTLENDDVGGNSTGGCCNRAQSTCTSLDGMRPDTIAQIANIKNACGAKCTVTVTGGTEVGHDTTAAASHENGYKVDISDGDNTLNAFFAHLTDTGQRGGDHGGEIFTDKCGNQYVHEADYHHWDITVKSACGF